MKHLARNTFIIVLMISQSLNITAQQHKNTSSQYYTLEDFRKVQKTDAHCHLNTCLPDFVLQAKEDNFRLITINLDDVNEPPPMDTLQQFALAQMKAFPGTVNYATTFSVRNFNDSNWQESAIHYLKNSFGTGAVAVKIYKVIGMTLRDPDGKLVMIDDSRFDPVINFIEQQHIPVLGHLGEPKNCWLPVEQMTIRGDKSYFSHNHEYYMYLHPEMPSYEDQVAARDHLLEKHPNLRFIGAHLGSLEWSVDELAKRLDKFPNMAVDMAARIAHFQYQSSRNRKKVRDFIIKYQDRLIYATDREAFPDSDPAQLKKSVHDTWSGDWEYLATDHLMSGNNFKGNFTGLKLPKTVVDKIYRLNAENWYPRIRED